MKKVIITAILALVLVLAMAGPAMAAVEQPASASVTVTTYISLTIADAGSDGIVFGSMDPTGVDQGDASQSDGTPSVVITAGAENNANVDLQISGTAFEKGVDNFAITNAKYSATFAGSKTAIPGTATDIVHGTDQVPGATVDMYQWLAVPGSTPPGAYSSTWTYKCVVV